MDNTPIGIGATGQYQATAVPAGSTIPNVPKWSSSDVTVATVEEPNSDPTGLTIKVTGVAGGTATLTITATRSDSNLAQGSIQVTIAAGEVQSFTVARIA